MDGRIRIWIHVGLLTSVLVFVSPTKLVAPSVVAVPVATTKWGTGRAASGNPLLTQQPQAAPRPEVARKIDALLARRPYKYAEWGLEVCALDTDEIIYTRNGEKLFPPASNAKVFTTAAALDRLGPNFRFLTRLAYEGTLAGDQRLVGDLVLVGGGDPNLANNLVADSNHFVFLDQMAQSVRQAGIAVVEGDVIGDDSCFSHVPFGEGWTLEDVNSDYGAPISALSFSHNVITLNLRPSRRIGKPASTSAYPSETFLTVLNASRTVPRGTANTISWSYYPGTARVSVRGQIPVSSQGASRYFSVADPALYTASILRERLIRAGVRVTGRARSRHAGDDVPRRPAHLLHLHESLPLSEVVSYINKKSQNLCAEILLRTLGAHLKGVGTDQAGLEVVYEFLAEAGIDRAAVDLHDGSGLSRDNQITPRAELLLLRYVAKKPYFPEFLSSLAVSGLDGTLQGRMRYSPAARRVFAKTGTLNNVSTLGGYVMATSGRTLAFSIFINNHSFGINTAKRALDRICDLLAQL